MEDASRLQFGVQTSCDDPATKISGNYFVLCKQLTIPRPKIQAFGLQNAFAHVKGPIQRTPCSQHLGSHVFSKAREQFIAERLLQTWFAIHNPPLDQFHLRYSERFIQLRLTARNCNQKGS